MQKQELKIKQDKSTLDKTEASNFQGQIRESEVELPEGINEFEEVVRPNGKSDDFQISSDIPTFEPPAEQSLSFKQKIASMLQNNQLLMKVPFIKNFAEKQLNVLPPPTRETKTSNTPTVNKTRENFINELTNFGAYRNLPPIKRMSDPEKMAQMQRKMEQKQQANGADGR